MNLEILVSWRGFFGWFGDWEGVKFKTELLKCSFQEEKHEKSHKDNSAWLLHVWPQ